VPFPWLHADVPAAFAATFAKKAETSHLREAEERAGLLCRLGFSRTEAKRRVRGNVRWEWELHGMPRFLAELDGVVDSVYARGGRTRQGPPVLD
jgi:hypothetical protein